MRSIYMIPLGLLLGSTAPASQDTSGAMCNAQYSLTLRGELFRPEANKRMPILLIAGSSGPPASQFKLLDDDGFLSLVMLLRAWEAQGKTAANQNAPVAIQVSDLNMLEYASRIGENYFGAVVDYAATLPSITPEQVVEVQQAKEQLALFRRVGEQARGSIEAATGADGVLPAGFIRSVGSYLEQLRPSAQHAFNSRYHDELTGGTQRLCDPSATNTLVGKMLCDRDLGTGALRAGAHCRSTKDIASPAQAPTCVLRAIDGKGVARECTAGWTEKEIDPPEI
ncbi:MAG: hypothetical protein V4808_04755 [Pseudomonadota bacterium]